MTTPNIPSNDLPNVIFVCRHNANRSQIAEALLRSKFGDHFNAFSAGTERTQVNPRAKLALDELGIDTSAHSSKLLDDLKDIPMDYVVSVCNSAKEACVYFPARIQNIHHQFQDPSKVKGTEEEITAAYRKACTDIGAWIDEFFGELAK